jgi:hypothetical protein
LVVVVVAAVVVGLLETTTTTTTTHLSEYKTKFLQSPMCSLKLSLYMYVLRKIS